LIGRWNLLLVQKVRMMKLAPTSEMPDEIRDVRSKISRSPFLNGMFSVSLFLSGGV
jgi:hypothetical protein